MESKPNLGQRSTLQKSLLLTSQTLFLWPAGWRDKSGLLVIMLSDLACVCTFSPSGHQDDANVTSLSYHGLTEAQVMQGVQ